MDIYPVKAQYLTNEEVLIHFEFEGVQVDSISLSVYQLENLVCQVTLNTPKLDSDVSIGTFRETFAGFGVNASVCIGDKTTVLETAFDVVDNPKRSLRYGFLSDFTDADIDNGAIESLRKYHINMVQFYDWSYRHDSLVSDDAEYDDMMGKHISAASIRSKIQKGLSLGMHSIAYGAVYAASEKFYREHPEWGFYNSEQEPFVFIDVFYIMNIEADSPWRSHLLQQYRNAVAQMGFAGIHMDTYGFPKTAYSHLHGRQKLVKLDQEFPSLIHDARTALLNETPDPYLIFNNVGNWPVRATAASAQDAVYVEVWNPYERYSHIAQIVQQARIYGGTEKPVILAAYMKPFQDEGLYLGAAEAAYILTAAIVSQGAYHLLLGERNAVLTQGYYSDYTQLRPAEAARMRRYYDFMVRYLNLFYDPALHDVSMTHIGWDNYEYTCTSHAVSPYGEAGKIWVTIKECDSRKCIYLVNLSGCPDDYWNKEKPVPVPQADIQFTVQVDNSVKGIYTATPDSDSALCRELDFTEMAAPQGKFVKFTLPELLVWSVVWVEL